MMQLVTEDSADSEMAARENKRLTIVHLTASRFLGGPEQQILQLANGLTPKFRNVVLSFSEGGLAESFINTARARDLDANILTRDTPHLIATTTELKSRLAAVGADILVCNGYKADLLGLLAARRLGIPILSVSRGWTAECPRVRFYEAIDRRVLRRMDAVVCVSHGQADKVLKAGVARHKVYVIHNAVHLDRIGKPSVEGRAELQSFFPQPPTHIIGAAGRLSPEKGFDVFVEATAQVLKQNATTGFVLFGDGVLKETLAHQIHHAGIQDRFVLAGFRSDFSNLLPNLDLFVQSSHTEGLPNVILEACAAGVPVIATDVGGTREIIVDGRSGHLVQPGEVQQLADKILHLIGPHNTRLATVDCGKETIETKFSAELQKRRITQLIRVVRQESPCVGDL